MPLKLRKRVKARRRDELRPFTITAGAKATITAADDQPGEDGKPKLGTFKGNAYTGAVMEPGGWYGRIVVDLAGVRVPKPQRPALRQHDHEQIVGHTTAVTVGAAGIEVEGVFSGQPEHTEKVTVPAANGFEWELSIGADPVRTEFLEAGEDTEVNGQTVVGPCTISRETVLGEISFVPLGADGDTSVSVSASRGDRAMRFRAMLKAAMKAAGDAAKYSDDEIDAMDEDEAKAALKECMADGESETEGEEDEDDDEEDEEAPQAKAKAGAGTKVRAAAKPPGVIARREQLRAERQEAAAEVRRVNGIKARCAKYPGAVVKDKQGVEQDLVAYAIEHGWSADKAEMKAELWQLKNSRPGPGVGVPGGLAYSTTTPEVTALVLEAAVLHAARHQFALWDDDFYLQPTPDNKGVMRRVSAHLQRDTQRDLNARYTDQVQQAAHTHFRRGIAPSQIFKAAAQAWGYAHHLDLSGEEGVRDFLKAWDHNENRPKYAGQSAIRADGTSTISVSNILSNVQNKFALQGYLFVEQAWREFCAIKPVSDFKETKSINLLANAMFQPLGPTGEVANASIGDQAFSNKAAPYAIIATIPWTHIVGDDLGMFTGVPMKLGQGAGTALNDFIWRLWAAMAAGTVNGDDGNAFWRTTSSVTAAAMRAGTAYKPNKQTGAGSAFGDAGLKAAKALFDNQIDPNGNPLGFDGLTPILLHGPALWRDVTAQMMAPAIVYGGASAANAPNANPWGGMMKPVMSRYVENANYVNSTTAYWLLFNPIALSAIEVCFLGGNDTPAVLTAGPDFQFDKLGISIRGSMPFGATQQNFRGGVYSVGA